MSAANAARPARGAAPVPVETAADLEQKRNRHLLHALHTAHPVMYRGQQNFIHTLHVQVSGGGTGTTLYLTGDPAPVDPAEVTIQELAT